MDTPGIETYPNSVYLPGTIKLKTDVSKLRSGIGETPSIPRQVWTQAEIENKTPFSKTGKTDNITDFRKNFKWIILLITPHSQLALYRHPLVKTRGAIIL